MIKYKISFLGEKNQNHGHVKARRDQGQGHIKARRNQISGEVKVKERPKSRRGQSQEEIRDNER